VLARLAMQGAGRRCIDVRGLAEDFRLDAPATSALLSALVAGGLLRPDGEGAYLPTARFSEHAQRSVVMPLTRERARALVAKAAEIAERVNRVWASNPYQIETIGVSGDYMSRRDPLEELSLWLVLRHRQKRSAGAMLDKSEAVRQIGTAIKALSPFVCVRVVSDRQRIERPFAIVFEADEGVPEPKQPAWEKLWHWSGRRGSK
jgi:hypothetical protein